MSANRQYAKGFVPPDVELPPGVTLMCGGYPAIGGELLHLIAAAKALGRRLPRGVQVHHHDENRLNYANSNLVICQDNRYHKLLHQRMRVLKAGFDPNTHKHCTVCKTYQLKESFNKHRARFDGLDLRCRACMKQYNQDYRMRNGRTITQRRRSGRPVWTLAELGASLPAPEEIRPESWAVSPV